MRGLFEIVAAIELRKHISGGWALALAGILSTGFGVLLAAHPAPGVLALVWLIGTYAVLFGATMIVLAFMLHALPGKFEFHPGRV